MNIKIGDMAIFHCSTIEEAIKYNGECTILQGNYPTLKEIYFSYQYGGDAIGVSGCTVAVWRVKRK